MRYDARMLMVKKKQAVSLPKTLNIVRCWNVIGPTVAKEIGANDYTPIPYCFDMNAYKIGHIFVPTTAQIKCCRGVPVLKILGPIRDFAVKAATNFKWIDKEFYSVRTTSDHVNLMIALKGGKNEVNFTGHDYYFLSKAQDMPTPGNVTINRAAHEDLLNATWIGLITSVVVARTFQLHVVKGLRARTMYLGDGAHTILFKYEICEIDGGGAVVNSGQAKIRCKWLPITDAETDSLPLTNLRSAAGKSR